MGDVKPMRRADFLDGTDWNSFVIGWASAAVNVTAQMVRLRESAASTNRAERLSGEVGLGIAIGLLNEMGFQLERLAVETGHDPEAARAVLDGMIAAAEQVGPER